jgi:glycosyltransferase involved in cell wall biosynthesis
MAVFNSLDFDGRVQRSAEALAEFARVMVFAIDGGTGFAPKGYEYVALPVRPGEFGKNHWLHLRFLHKLLALARRERPDLVYAHDFFMAFPGWLAARVSGARFVYDAHELIIPGSMEDSQGKNVERVWYRLERAIVGRADLVIAANQPRAEKMVEHYGLARVPTVVQNLTAPPVSRLDDATVRSRYPSLVRRSPAECLCVYQGDVNIGRGLDALLHAFDVLPSEYRLIVVGGGPDLNWVATHSKGAGRLGRIDVLGRVPREDLFDILRLCDVGVVTYSFSGLNNLYCAPNKVFEYAHGGIPIVATSQPSLLEMVGQSGIGCIAGDGGPPTAEQMADAIVRAHTGREKYIRAIKPFLARNTWQVEADRLRGAVMTLLSDACRSRMQNSRGFDA